MAGDGERRADRSAEFSGTAGTRRKAILTVATSAFAERGYDGASLREIAERVGIAKGNLTYHFAIKDDLLFEIVAELHDHFLRLVDSWISSEDTGPELLRRALGDHVLTVCAHSSATRVSYEAFRYLTPERRSIIVAKRDRYEAAFAGIIRQAQQPARRGDNALDVVRVRLILGLLNWPYQWYSPKGSLSANDLADIVADMATRALQR